MAAGAWLGALQVSLFLSLQMLLSSAYPAYLATLLAWLCGAAAGVWVPRGALSPALAVLTGAAPYGVLALLELRPYEAAWLPAHASLVALSSMYAGHLFQQERESFADPGRLFFWENTGFVLGLAAGTGGMLAFGRTFAWWAPGAGLAATACVYWLTLTTRRMSSRTAATASQRSRGPV